MSKIKRLFESMSLTLVLMVSLFATNACAENPASVSQESTATDGSQNESVPKWLGTYEPLSRACEKNILSIDESKFSWGNCKKVGIRSLSKSETEYVFEADPNAKCGWAGWLIALTIPSPESGAVSVNAYRSLRDYQAKHSIAFCAYSKNF